MELTYDWCSFRTLFYPLKRTPAAHNTESAAPIYIVTDEDLIISIFTEFEDLSGWIGSRYTEVIPRLSNRQVIRFERKRVEEMTRSALELPHYYDQLEHLWAQANDEIKTGAHCLVKRHFILEAIQSGWSKLLPSAYGIFIRLDGDRVQDLLLIIRRGRLAAFHEPDLSSMGPDRRRQPADVVKYLSEKHLVRVQGIFLAHEEWMSWAGQENPWPQVLAAFRERRLKLAPFRWSVVAMIFARAIFSFKFRRSLPAPTPHLK